MRAEKPVNATRVLIVDDHPLVRQAIALLLEAEEDFQVCGETEDAQTALAIIETARVELVILDITLKNSDGFSMLKEIKGRFPAIKVLFFSAHDESTYALRALRAGASGYLTKGEPHAKLLLALRKIQAGGFYFSEKCEQELLNRQFKAGDAPPPPLIELLTNRELEVFNLIGQGYSTSEMAAKLNVAVQTIESHRVHIKEKFCCETWTELMRRAVEWTEHGTPPDRPEKNSSMPPKTTDEHA